jgi:LysM domain
MTSALRSSPAAAAPAAAFRFCRRRLLLPGLLAALLAGCATPEAPEPPPEVAPAPVAEPAAPAEAPAPAAPATFEPVDVPSTVRAAAALLDQGKPAEAEAELLKALTTDPNHPRAGLLMRQIREDPVTMLGAQSFQYRLQPGESLSAVAQKFLRDPLMFYVLARYNDIAVPGRVSAGQTIRVPGREPRAAPSEPTSASASPAATSSPAVATPATPAADRRTPAPVAAAPAGAVAPPAPGATGAAKPAVAAAPKPPAASVTAATPPPTVVAQAPAAPALSRATTRRIETLTREARACSAARDPCCAVRKWDQVLKLDPANKAAADERAQSAEVIERMQKLGGAAC